MVREAGQHGAYDDGCASFPAILHTMRVRVEPRTRWDTMLTSWRWRA